MDLILMIVLMGAIMYFLLFRPQQKRMKEHQNLISSLEPGSRVLLASGIFATIVHAGERQFIVELAPGVEITIMKAAVQRVVTPDEEEFEFEDDVQGSTGGAYATGAYTPDDAMFEGTGPDYAPADEDHVATDEELKAMFEGPSEDDPLTEPGDDDNVQR